MEINSEDDLVQEIESKLKSFQSLVVGVDGFMNSGKSRLAMKLASELEGFRISFDSHLDPGCDETHYIDKLHLKYLAEDLHKIKDKFQLVVVEGICFLDVLERIGFPFDFRIYVKRIGTNGLWYDGHHLEDYMGNRTIKENEFGLHKSEFDYHASRLPHECADYVYLRVESE